MHSKSPFTSLGSYLALALAIGLAGCGSLGPRTLDRDQIDYGNSVGDNWKNQMLANLVKIRFVDMPVFVDVGQIVSGYTLETQVNGTLGWGTTLAGGDAQALVERGGRRPLHRSPHHHLHAQDRRELPAQPARAG